MEISQEDCISHFNWNAVAPHEDSCINGN